MSKRDLISAPEKVASVVDRDSKITTANNNSDNRLVAVTDIAELARVSVSAVSNWRKRYADFPTAADQTSTGDLFALSDVVTWLERSGRRVHGHAFPAFHERLRELMRSGRLAGEETLLVVLQVLSMWRACSQKSDRQVSLHDWTQLVNSDGAAFERRWEQLLDSAVFAQDDNLRSSMQLLPGPQQFAMRLMQAVGELSGDDRFGQGARDIGKVATELILSLQENESARFAGAYTSPSLASLMVQLTLPVKGTIYDPAAGHAMTLAEAADNADGNEVEVVGQEISELAWRIGVLHLRLRGIRGTLHKGDSLRNDAFRNRTADRIILDAPLGARVTLSDTLLDPRWQYGTTPTAEWMWAQHITHHLSPNGIAVMTITMGALSRSGRDAKVRGGLVRDGEIDAVISLPPGLIAGTNMPIALVVFDRARRGKRSDILFIDARQLGTARRGKINELSTDAAQKIVRTVESWRRGEAVDEPTFAAVAQHQEILSATGFDSLSSAQVDLSPQRYVRYIAQVDTETSGKRLRRIKSAVGAVDQSLEPLPFVLASIRDAARAFRESAENWPLVRLRELLMENPVAGTRLDSDGSGVPYPWMSTSFVTSSGSTVRQAPTEISRGRLRGRAARRGDLLIASRGIDANSKRITCTTIEAPGEFAFSDSLLMLAPNPNILDANYLRYALTSESGIAALAAVTTGSVIANLRPAALMEVEIRVPPLAMQQWIASALRKIERAATLLGTAAEETGLLLAQLRDVTTAGLMAARDSNVPNAPIESNTSGPASADPRIHPIGILVDSETHGSRYYWFANDAAALSWYVNEYLSARYLNEEVWSEVGSAFAWASEQQLGISMLAAELNAITRRVAHLAWYGTFSELRNGRSSQGRYVCAEFWESKAAGGGFAHRIDRAESLEEQSWVTDEDLPTFVNMLQQLAH